MTVRELLERAKANGLTVSLEGGRLMVAAPQEPQGEVRALIEELRQLGQQEDLFAISVGKSGL